MTELMQASTEWMKRPSDERFVSLPDMAASLRSVRTNSRAVIVPNRKIRVVPQNDHRGLSIEGPSGAGYNATHFSFGQLAGLAGAPAGYLRKLPAELVADNLNYGLHVLRDVEETGLLLTKNGASSLRAATGPNYGRIWNCDIVDQLMSRFGDGVSGDWKVPGEFGKAVTVTKANTTLYASDRDMFVFLADEKNRIEVPNRRDGKPGAMARGFFVWNSEVGAATLGIKTFLFDYACCNRIVWGAADVKGITVRHTSGAPDRWLEEVVPAIDRYAAGSATGVLKSIADAKVARIADKLDAFLAERFGKGLVAVLKETHVEEEGRPIETLWDVTTAATAYARRVPYQDERVGIETKAGEVMALAA